VPIRKYGDVFLNTLSRDETIGFCAELGKQAMKIAAREGPLEGVADFSWATRWESKYFDDRRGRSCV